MMHIAREILNWPLLVFCITAVLCSFAVWLGHLASKRAHDLNKALATDLNIIQAATLTLLALIIGFTFSMAITRHDLRENLEATEANVIGTEYLRTDLLPEQVAAKAKKVLIQYLDIRIDYYETHDHKRLEEIYQETDRLQTQLWDAVAPSVRSNQTPVMALVAAGMNEVIDSEGFTVASWAARLPVTAWILMCAIALFANLLLGFGAYNFARKTWIFLVFPFITAISFFLIADIDSPRGGAIKIIPRNLQSLKQSIDPNVMSQQPSGKTN